jgi:hypothetical protein
LITHVCKPFIDAILRQAPRWLAGMNAMLGWGLVALAVAAGWLNYGWRGVALACTVTVFWLLLQFSRSLRVLRDAASQPMGRVPNAVMFSASLQVGQRLPAVLKTTRSLGRKLADEPETFAWADESGDEVQVELRNGRVTAWRLSRAAGGQN